jgi:protein-S-isoprenylcysteine O-methyltransferase Ste14
MSTRIAFWGVLLFLMEDLWEQRLPNSFLDLSDHWGMIGLALVAVGVLLRSWSAGMLRKQEVLVTTGPYALMRHPLYCGSLLIALGFCTIIGDWENFGLVAVLVALHVRKARREERMLREKFGVAWEEYCRRVGPLCPKTVPAAVLVRWSLRQWGHNREYGAFVTVVGCLVLMTIWHLRPHLLWDPIAKVAARL